MQRITEPELMNGKEQSYAYANADLEEINDNFVNFFQDTFGDKHQGYMLDIGCGHADITLRFAKAYPDYLIDGIDGSEAMLYYGRQALKKEPLDVQKRVKLIEGTVPDIRLNQLHYDAIVSNYCLHHLHNPSVWWEFIRSYGVDGTKIIIGDLLRPSSPEKAREIVELEAKDEPEIHKYDYYNSLLAAFEISEIKQQLKLANMENLSVKQISDHYVIISGFLNKSY